MENVKKKFDICEVGCDIIPAYHSGNRWIDDNKIVVLKKEKKTKKYYLMLFSLKDERSEILTEVLSGHIDYTVSGNHIIYTDGYKIYKLNFNTLEKQVIFELDLDENELKVLFDTENNDKKIKNFLIMPRVTNDGKYISFFQLHVNYDTMEVSGYIPEKYSICYVIDIETKKICYQFKKGFSGSAWVANHFAINPSDHNLVAFSHEGDSVLVANRVWFYDNKTGDMYNAAKQRMTDNMDLGDSYGHEVWSHNGNGMYIVKYRESAIKPSGIIYLDRNSLSQKMLYTKFEYWHVCASNDDKYLVADTVADSQTVESDIVLINQEKKTEIPLDRVRVTWSHPCHAHPQMSPDNGKICYSHILENGDIALRIAFIEDV